MMMAGLCIISPPFAECPNIPFQLLYNTCWTQAGKTEALGLTLCSSHLVTLTERYPLLPSIPVHKTTLYNSLTRARIAATQRLTNIDQEV